MKQRIAKSLVLVAALMGLAAPCANADEGVINTFDADVFTSAAHDHVAKQAGSTPYDGITDFTIDASGDLLHRRADPLRIALEHPGDATRAIGVADLPPGRALCASATNRRAWGEGLHHVLDGRTGRPTSDVVATWVVADSCLLADGLATAHFLADPARLMPRFDHEFVRMHADGRVEWSPDFPGEVFS